VDAPVLVSLHRTTAINRLADQVEHAAQRGFADGHLHRIARIDALLAADHAVGAAQGDAADAAAAQVLLHLADQIELDALVFRRNLHGVENRRQAMRRKLDVERRADDLRDVADVLAAGCV
jgi:hypothetical protein